MASRRPYKNVMELKVACYKRIVEKLDVLSPQQPDDLLQSLREDVKMLICDHETDYFMSIANLAALRSKDPWTPVGACIVNAEKKVVGIGYNAMPYTPFCDNDDEKQFPWTKGFQDEKLNKHSYVCHAALNAIVNRTIPNLDGCTMYLTLHPDHDCAHLIVQSEIKEVLYDEMLSSKRIKDLKELSSPTFINACDILRLGRVSLRKCKPKIEIELTKRKHQKVDHKYLVNEHFVTESRTLQTDHGFEQTLISGVRCLKKEVRHAYNWLPGLSKENYLVTQDSGSIKKYLLVREDAEERVLTSEAANSAHVLLTLQKRLTSSVRRGVINMDLVISWDELFMGLALLEKKFINLNDKKPSSKQGACIVTPLRQILAIGGSGLSPGVNHDAMEETFIKIGGGDPYVCHAEYNAITSYRGVISLKGSTLYVTLSPCNVCAKLIAQAGIVEVVYRIKLDNTAYRFEITEKIFKNCNIKFRCMYDNFDVRIDVQGIVRARRASYP